MIFVELLDRMVYIINVPIRLVVHNYRTGNEI